ncbi:glycoside hydrolase family 1 protein [Neobacillus drentensis]|uniref:glycoside hydrolase family 1 protein n=1 Tax=Neobacillus drentensis TaxID=220684 RepID=UPI001F2DB5FC|nr:glycoside hydrolase family 1 protein [Neobacillus drentensis]ULT58279.1 glycoside hydrolase family 1 protein [Neobacillus drentensis]
MKYVFPKSFLWGTATSAYQVEGNNEKSDMWAEEYSKGSPYRDYSGDAVDHYNQYKQDIELMAGLGLNSYRFSIEWSRIEPAQGVYSQKELEHYRDVIKVCNDNHITPVVTMMHFTSPQWLMKLGGWKNPETADLFAKYCEAVFKEFGHDIPYVLTMNEVNLPVMLKELFINMNFMPPVGVDAKSWTAPGWRESAAEKCGTTTDQYFTFHMASDETSLEIVKDAHRKAREAMKRVNPSTKVGLSLALPEIQAIEGGEEQAAKVWHDYFGQFKSVIEGDDFIGIQNYTREVYGPEGQVPLPEGTEVTAMGYEFYPEALAGTIRNVAAELGIPVLVTEHGIATDDDSRRIEFIRRGLRGLHACIEDGIQVLGYLYWSTFDNYEWTFGYEPHFGIIGVNRETQERVVKESGRVLGDISKNNGVNE